MGTAEADIVLVPGHRVVTVKVLDMVMVMVNVLVMVITMAMVIEWLVRTIGDSKQVKMTIVRRSSILTSSYIMAYGLISAITWLIITVIFMLLQYPFILHIATRIAFEKYKSGFSPQLKASHRHFSEKHLCFWRPGLRSRLSLRGMDQFLKMEMNQ